MFLHFFNLLFFFIFGLFGVFGCLALSGVLRVLASLLIEIASSRGAGVHACDRHRLSFFVLISGYLRFVGAIVLCLAFLLGLFCSRPS